MLRVLLFFLTGLVAAGAEVLVYHDGDRVQGKLLRREGGVMVFLSPRFGEIRVGAAEAEVRGEEAMPNESLPEASPAPGAPVLAEELASASRWWHPWKGRVGLSLQWLRDDSSDEDLAVEFRLEREWARDELRYELHYSRKLSNDVLNEDIWRGSAYWRHVLENRFFTLYNPLLEWDRSFNGLGPQIPEAEYGFTQQQLGLGYEIVTTEWATLRAGVAENWVWLRIMDPVQIDYTQWFESVFFEAELDLPKGWKLRERGQLYLYRGDMPRGWDNTLELTKRLGDLLSVTVRHEYRINRPSLQVSDYNKLRLLLGLDF
ncbi:MAG: hypothetical protein IT582_06280 [Opitutaceae bacterium]|nr:hypothetical protein [Opitutaceae bacterium]